MARLKSQILLSFLISLIVIISIIVFVGLNNISAAITRIQNNPLPILVFVLIFSLSFTLRAVRWKFIVPEASMGVLIRSLYVAWFFNGVTPARLGDAARVYFLKTEESVNIGEGLASVIIDRILDLICLLAIFPSYLYFTFEGRELDEISQFFLLTTIIITLVALILVFLTAWRPETMSLVISQLLGFMGEKTTQKISQLIKSASMSIRGFSGNKKAVTGSIFVSFPIWIFESMSTYLIAQAMDIEVSFFLCLLAATFGFFAMTIPITPAGWGSFELAIAAVLSISLPLETALLIALVDHVIRQVYVALIGGIALQSFSGTFFETFAEIQKLRA